MPLSHGRFQASVINNVNCMIPGLLAVLTDLLSFCILLASPVSI